MTAAQVMVRRSAYTTVELLSVVAIVSVIFSLLVPSIYATSKRAAVSGAAQELLQLHEAARSLAITNSPSGDNSHYGVVVVQDPQRDPPCYAAIIYGHGSDGENGHAERIYQNGLGQDVMRFEFNRNVTIWSGADELIDSGLKGELAWYYEYRTGQLIVMDAGGDFDRQPWSVGGEATEFKDLYGIGGNDYVVPTIAPPDAADPESFPGLSFRTLDDHLRIRVDIVAPGIGSAKEF